MEGSKVYIPDPVLAWVPGTLVSIDEVARVAQVQVDGQQGPELRQVDLKSADFKPMDYTLPLQNVNVSDKGVDDMTSLNYLHEPAILYNLRRRFEAACPYTYTGDICIAVNPYQWLDHLYTVEVRDKYLYHPKAELSPHVYAISASAYRGIATDGMNQSILVSGESGAGKTETVKILMSHLATSSEEEMSHAGVGGDQQQQHNTIEKVLQSNPLLESFGNAKTVRNDNSSRFGKFTQLEFRAYRRHHSSEPSPCLLLGSRCVTYLLEKSRIVHHSAGERNYHIFYQLLAAPEDVKSQFRLSGKTVKDFFYMTGDHGGSDTTVIEGKSDAERFNSTCKALGLIGVLGEPGVREGQLELFRALAGILYLGETEIVAHEEGNEEGSKVVNEAALATAAELLGCNPPGLATALCRRTVKTRNETYSVPMNENQARDARDALAKELYSRFFLWLVGKINGSTAPSVPAKGLDSHIYSTIGLLDIFGFESFAVNRFEQLCINYCNEKLQQKFTLDTFKTVQNEYEDEGISWNFIEFKDNAPVLDLIEGRVGIITVLNEECMLPKGSDPTFTSKLTTIHAEHPNLIKERLSKVEFSIVHYAGTVKYTSQGFVTRNKDTLPDDLGKAMAASSSGLVRCVFNVVDPDADADDISTSKAGAKRKKGALVGETVTTKFKSQLAELMDTITATRVQYIRCIKPNPVKSKTIMDHLQVVEQLRCAGVIEAIRISRAAYPNRTRHTEFLSRFLILLDSNQIASLPEVPHGKLGGGPSPGGLHRIQAEVCRKALAYLVKEEGEEEKEKAGGKLPYEVGKTRVYFRSGVLEELEERRLKSVSKKATTIQRYFRGYLVQQNYQRLRIATVLIQSLARTWRQKQKYEEDRRRVIVSQTMWRSRQARRFVHEKRIETRSTTIQAAVRRFLCVRDYNSRREKAIRIQALARMRRQRKTYLAELAEAKEQAKLENQLEMLKRRLEEESLARQKAEEELINRQQQAPQQQAVPDLPLSPVLSTSGGGGGGGGGVSAANGLMEQQGAMLEYLKKKVVKYRDQFMAMQRENEGLKKDIETLRAENQRVKDAHAAAGMSFTALNQHSSQLQRIYKKLMTEHQERLDEIGKLNSRVAGYQEELNMKHDLYTMEVQVNRKQDRTMAQMVDLVAKRVGDIDPELVEELVELHNTCTAAVRLQESMSSGHHPTGSRGGGHHHKGHLANGGQAVRSPSESSSALSDGENAVRRVSKSLLSGFSKIGAFVTGGDL